MESFYFPLLRRGPHPQKEGLRACPYLMQVRGVHLLRSLRERSDNLGYTIARPGKLAIQPVTVLFSRLACFVLTIYNA
jgi:hypothetical protein